jgi:hypothetical protein
VDRPPSLPVAAVAAPRLRLLPEAVVAPWTKLLRALSARLPLPPALTMPQPLPLPLALAPPPPNQLAILRRKLPLRLRVTPPLLPCRVCCWLPLLPPGPCSCPAACELRREESA